MTDSFAIHPYPQEPSTQGLWEVHDPAGAADPDQRLSRIVDQLQGMLDAGELDALQGDARTALALLPMMLVDIARQVHTLLHPAGNVDRLRPVLAVIDGGRAERG